MQIHRRSQMEWVVVPSLTALPEAVTSLEVLVPELLAVDQVPVALLLASSAWP